MIHSFRVQLVLFDQIKLCPPHGITQKWSKKTNSGHCVPILWAEKPEDEGELRQSIRSPETCPE